jgi:hypothetical protein
MAISHADILILDRMLVSCWTSIGEFPSVAHRTLFHHIASAALEHISESLRNRWRVQLRLGLPTSATSGYIVDRFQCGPISPKSVFFRNRQRLQHERMESNSVTDRSSADSSGISANSRDDSDAWLQPGWIEHTQLLLDSYRRWTNRELIARTGSDRDQARSLYLAPFVVVSHGTQPDPILNYGNQTALTLWEMPVEDLLRTPSRMTAEPLEREERARLMERTTRLGFVDDYQGIRISSTGRRFRIDQATVWNLIDPSGQLAGQAATFSEWTFLDE